MSTASRTAAVILAAAVRDVQRRAAVQQKARTAVLHPITPKIAETARPLPLNAVRLTGGPLKRAQELDADYLLTLEPDRMLAFYRTRAGLPKKAEPYGGWDGEGRQLTGTSPGTTCPRSAYMWAATGDARFKQRADYIVAELKVVQDAQRRTAISARSWAAKKRSTTSSKGNIKSASFDLNGLWSPWYTLHKTYAGLRDAYRYTGNRSRARHRAEIRRVGREHPAEAGRRADPEDARTREFGGMNEVLADLYADTGDRRWLDLSYHFEHQAGDRSAEAARATILERPARQHARSRR